MSTVLQTRLAAIKAKCEEILRLSEKATQGDWHVEKGRDHVWIGNKCIISVNLWEIVHSEDIKDFKDEAIEQAVNNARFIAHARNVSPAMARVVLGTLAEAEKMKDMEGGDMWLEEIANQWDGK